jgi:hypothetical protein
VLRAGGQRPRGMFCLIDDAAAGNTIVNEALDRRRWLSEVGRRRADRFYYRPQILENPLANAVDDNRGEVRCMSRDSPTTSGARRFPSVTARAGQVLHSTRRIRPAPCSWSAQPPALVIGLRIGTLIGRRGNNLPPGQPGWLGPIPLLLRHFRSWSVLFPHIASPTLDTAG